MRKYLLFVAAFDKHTQEYELLIGFSLNDPRQRLYICPTTMLHVQIQYVPPPKRSTFSTRSLQENLYYGDLVLDNARKETALHDHQINRYDFFSFFL